MLTKEFYLSEMMEFINFHSVLSYLLWKMVTNSLLSPRRLMKVILFLLIIAG